jgi:hypothetical protein
MDSRFVVIDSFRVTPELAPRVESLALGTWFVMEGAFPSDISLPPMGQRVAISKPSGELLHSHIAGAVVRHGALAMRFATPEVSDLPRLAVVSIREA